MKINIKKIVASMKESIKKEAPKQNPKVVGSPKVLFRERNMMDEAHGQGSYGIKTLADGLPIQEKK